MTFYTIHVHLENSYSTCKAYLKYYAPIKYPVIQDPQVCYSSYLLSLKTYLKKSRIHRGSSFFRLKDHTTLMASHEKRDAKAQFANVSNMCSLINIPTDL